MKEKDLNTIIRILFSEIKSVHSKQAGIKYIRGKRKGNISKYYQK
jgi:hypothetical protein